MQIRTVGFSALALMVGTLALSGCGDSSSSGESKPGTTPSTQSPAEAPGGNTTTGTGSGAGAATEAGTGTGTGPSAGADRGAGNRGGTDTGAGTGAGAGAGNGGGAGNGAGGSNTEVPSTAGQTIPAADFCAAYALALCDTSERCCVDPAFSESTCVTDFSQLCTAEMLPLFSDPAYVYDPTVAGDCLEAIRQISCADPYAPSTACNTLLLGTAKAGDDCSATGLCAAGLQCGYDLRTQQQLCVVPGAGNQACVAETCVDGFYCDGSDCLQLAPLGGACTSNSGCTPSLYCDDVTSVCAAPKAEGLPCTDDAECLSYRCDGTPGALVCQSTQDDFCPNGVP